MIQTLNQLCIQWVLAKFQHLQQRQGQCSGHFWETGWSVYGLFWAHSYTISNWTELICNKSLKQRRLVALNKKKKKKKKPHTKNPQTPPPPHTHKKPPTHNNTPAPISQPGSFYNFHLSLFTCPPVPQKRVYPNNWHTCLVALLKSDFLLTILCAWILFQNVSSQRLFQILFSCPEQERHDISMSIFSPKQQNCLRTACLILQQLRTLWLVAANIKGNYNVWPSTASQRCNKLVAASPISQTKTPELKRKKKKGWQKLVVRGFPSV